MSDLVGAMQHFRLPTLLQAVEAEQLTGIFDFQPLGQIRMRNGEVVGAEYGRLQGVAAALTLVVVGSSQGTFRITDAVPETAVLIDSMALMIDGARLQDDWANLQAQVLGKGADLQMGSLSPVVQRVVALLDGQVTVAEAVKEADANLVEVLDPLLELKEQGSLIQAGPPRPDRVPILPAPAPVEASPEPAAAVPTDGRSFFELVDASRVALRKRKYDEAMQLLTAAAVLRPDDPVVGQNLRRLAQLQNSN